MRILFDQNVPRGLTRHLATHEVTRSVEVGWEEFKNGELLRAAEVGAFELLLTCDLNLEYQQAVTGRKIAIVALSTNNWPLIRAVTNKVTAAVDGAQPGTYSIVDCGTFRRAVRRH